MLLAISLPVLWTEKLVLFRIARSLTSGRYEGVSYARGGLTFRSSSSCRTCEKRGCIGSRDRCWRRGNTSEFSTPIPWRARAWPEGGRSFGVSFGSQSRVRFRRGIWRGASHHPWQTRCVLQPHLGFIRLSTWRASSIRDHHVHDRAGARELRKHLWMEGWRRRVSRNHNARRWRLHRHRKPHKPRHWLHSRSGWPDVQFEPGRLEDQPYFALSSYPTRFFPIGSFGNVAAGPWVSLAQAKATGRCCSFLGKWWHGYSNPDCQSS